MPAGRPTLYTEALGVEICQRMADGESLRQICRDEHMPTDSAVRGWAIDPDHPISARYTRARAELYARWAEEVVEISDDGTNDWIEKERRDGSKETVLDQEHVQRSRLRVDTRKWLLSKLMPKQYGDKMQHTGEDDGPITLVVKRVGADGSHD